MNKSEDLKNNNLILPIYLNEEVVVDMLAIIEDGFSYVSNISVVSSTSSESNKKLDANGGISGILNRLLKIDLEGSYDNQKQSGTNQTETTQKIHTLASLFSKFRDYLIKNNLLDHVNTDDISSIKPGYFIEVEGSLERNPVVSILDDYLNLLDISMRLSPVPVVGQKTKAKEEKAAVEKNVNLIREFSDSMKVEGMEDFIMRGEVSIVMSAQIKYFFKDNLSELIGGQFKVLGKVIQVYESENVDLLRKTPWTFLSNEQKKILDSIFQNESLKQFKVPEYKTEVNAPALAIIPIAIFA